MQHVVVAIIIAAALFYAGRQIRRALKRPYDPCVGCDGCQLNDAIRRRQTCEKKNLSAEKGENKHAKEKTG